MSINHSETEIVFFFQNAGRLRNYECWTYNNNTINVIAVYKIYGSSLYPNSVVEVCKKQTCKPGEKINFLY